MHYSRLVSIISIIFLCSFGLVIVSSWATQHAINGGNRLSSESRELVLKIARLPSSAKALGSLVQNLYPPEGVKSIYEEFKSETEVTQLLSGHLLIPYLSSNGVNEVCLINLSNKNTRVIFRENEFKKSTKYSDRLIGSDSVRHEAFSSRNTIGHPHVSQDGIITFLIPWNDLVSVDIKNKKELWRIRGSFHHSIETDFENNFWVCGSVRYSDEKKTTGGEEGVKSNSGIKRYSYEDQILVKISPKGFIIDSISVTDLLCESGLEFLLFGVSNPNLNYDPIHLNQITPVKNNLKQFKRGDLLVSLRNMSTILQVDPNARRVIWHKCGEWMNQHCVMISGETSFSLLDNHSFASGDFWLNKNWKTRLLVYDKIFNTTDEIVLFEPKKGVLKIPIEGRAIQVDQNSWLIEDSLYGTVIIFKDKRIVFKWSNNYSGDTVGISTWCRYIPATQSPKF